MVLLVLAVLWIAVLTPGILRKRAERRGTGSIDSFHRQLHLLERTGPKLAPIDHQEFGNDGQVASFPTVSSMPGRPNLVLLSKPVNGATPGPEATGRVYAEGPSATSTPLSEPAVEARQGSRQAEFVAYERRQSLKRRQQIAFGLVGTFVVTALLGMVPSLRMLWGVTLLAAMAIAGYIFLMVYARQMTADRRSRPASSNRTYSGEQVVVAGYQGASASWDGADRGYAAEDSGYYEPQPAFAYR